MNSSFTASPFRQPHPGDLFNWYFASEPILQPVWSEVLVRRRWFQSPLFPIVLSLFCYFGSTVPFTILDFYGYYHWRWVKRIKIQPNVQVKWSQVREAMALTAWNQILYVFPVSVAQCIWTPYTHLPTEAPSIIELLLQPYLALAIVDVEYYLWHVIHHRVRWLYKTVHSVHHKYATVNAWVGHYIHPWELFCAGVFGTTAPMILGCHPLTTWTFLAFLQYISVEDHCGYDISILPHSWLLPEPILGGPIKHSIHHQHPMSNLQPYFGWFDWLAGTDWKPGKDHDDGQPIPANDDDHQQAEDPRQVLQNGVTLGRRSDARQATRPRSILYGYYGNSSAGDKRR